MNHFVETARGKLAMLAVVLMTSSCGLRCGGEGRPADRPSTVAAEVTSPPSHAETAAACIDGERAMETVRRIAAIGARSPGSPGAEAVRTLIEDELRANGLSFVRDDFTAYTPHPDHPSVRFANFSADIAGPGRTVIVGGHFDAKLLDGIDFVGANDGGSSTALLLELARCLAKAGSPAAVKLAFFDGEEALVTWSDADSLYGSKRMAARLAESGAREEIAAMVNLDMIGDGDLGIVRETLSTPWVFDALVRSAERQGLRGIFNGARGSIEDDHVPFLRLGVPAADLIDFDYGAARGTNDYWHTAADTPNKLSAKSLAAVGRVVVGALAELSKGEPRRFAADGGAARENR